jgi:transcriptional regulator with XRE-family HTH domain
MERDHADVVLEYIGANVHRLRVRLGLSQEALSEAADISTGFLQRVERGKTNVGVVVLVRLADASASNRAFCSAAPCCRR